jgi:hypothetical protein
VFVELNTRHNAGITVSLEWDRETGRTRILIADAPTRTAVVFGVPASSAGHAFRHPFSYAP